MTRRSFVVDDEEAGERLDKAIASQLGVSRSVAASLQALVDGRELSNSTRLQTGQRVEVELAEEDQAAIKGQPVDFDVRFEDSDVAVIVKPAGLAVHPGAGRRESTLANGLIERWPGIRDVGEATRPGIVHRLDAGTSGLMLVALSKRAYEALVEQISAHEVERNYVALVLGDVQPPTGKIDAPIGRDPRRRKRMAVLEGGRHAITHYRATAHYAGGYSLVEVALETGRTHQIRVHMAAIGHPIAGDDTYGGGRASKKLGLHRPLLHSARIAFNHPVTGERIEIAEPLPPDLEGVLAVLGEPGDER
ncbi:MAG: RluA family pseudouridine synthase [Acidobacteria bacterium]|nr:MAG: RluA family pseudouridine synthase [Acidobacteriota bacterium]